MESHPPGQSPTSPAGVKTPMEDGEILEVSEEQKCQTEALGPASTSTCFESSWVPNGHLHDGAALSSHQPSFHDCQRGQQELQNASHYPSLHLRYSHGHDQSRNNFNFHVPSAFSSGLAPLHLSETHVPYDPVSYHYYADVQPLQNSLPQLVNAQLPPSSSIDPRPLPSAPSSLLDSVRSVDHLHSQVRLQPLSPLVQQPLPLYPLQHIRYPTSDLRSHSETLPQHLSARSQLLVPHLQTSTQPLSSNTVSVPTHPNLHHSSDSENVETDCVVSAQEGPVEYNDELPEPILCHGQQQVNVDNQYSVQQSVEHSMPRGDFNPGKSDMNLNCSHSFGFGRKNPIKESIPVTTMNHGGSQLEKLLTQTLTTSDRHVVPPSPVPVSNLQALRPYSVPRTARLDFAPQMGNLPMNDPTRTSSQIPQLPDLSSQRSQALLVSSPKSPIGLFSPQSQESEPAPCSQVLSRSRSCQSRSHSSSPPIHTSHSPVLCEALPKMSLPVDTRSIPCPSLPQASVLDQAVKSSAPSISATHSDPPPTSPWSAPCGGAQHRSSRSKDSNLANLRKHILLSMGRTVSSPHSASLPQSFSPKSLNREVKTEGKGSDPPHTKHMLDKIEYEKDDYFRFQNDRNVGRERMGKTTKPKSEPISGRECIGTLYGTSEMEMKSISRPEEEANLKDQNPLSEVLSVELSESDLEEDPFKKFFSYSVNKRKLSVEEQVENMKIRVVRLGKCPSALFQGSVSLQDSKRQKTDNSESEMIFPGRRCDRSDHDTDTQSPAPCFTGEVSREHRGKKSDVCDATGGEKIVSTLKNAQCRTRLDSTSKNLVASRYGRDVNYNLPVENLTVSDLQPNPAKASEKSISSTKNGWNPDCSTRKEPFQAIRNAALDFRGEGKRKSNEGRECTSKGVIEDSKQVTEASPRVASCEVDMLRKKIAELEKLRQGLRDAHSKKICQGIPRKNTSEVPHSPCEDIDKAANVKSTLVDKTGNGRSRYYNNGKIVSIIKSPEVSSSDSSQKSTGVSEHSSAKWNEKYEHNNNQSDAFKLVNKETDELDDLKSKLEMSKKELVLIQDYSTMMQRASISVAEASAKISFKRGRLKNIESEMKAMQLEVQEAEQDYKMILRAALAMRSSMKGFEESLVDFPDLEFSAPLPFEYREESNFKSVTREEDVGSNTSCAKPDVEQLDESKASDVSQSNQVFQLSPFSESSDKYFVSVLSAFRSYASCYSVLNFDWSILMTSSRIIF